MSGSVNKVIIVDLYLSGLSLTQVAEKLGISCSTVRHHVKKAGVLRSRTEGIHLAAEQGRLGSGYRGKKRDFTPLHCENISKGRKAWGEKNAKGTSVKPSGYVEYTTGPNKGRLAHVVEMEARIGRRLRDDEHVHHIDGDRSNNSLNNLALVTRSAHARLHRIQDQMIGKKRERDSHGRFR